jgi:hypothetical protein
MCTRNMKEESHGKRSTRRTKKRKRVPTPSEELPSDAEHHFAELKALAEERYDAADEDYRGISRASVAVDALQRGLRENKRLRAQPDGR